MSIFNGNKAFSDKRQVTNPLVKLPKNVKQSFNIDKAYDNGIFKIEPQKKGAIYDTCYMFEDINYINKNTDEQRNFLLEFMTWLNAMNVDFKITLANEHRSESEFLKSIRNETNANDYPVIQEGIREWQASRLKESNPSIVTCHYLTITARADSEANARIYLNAVDNVLKSFFTSWGSKIYKLGTVERLKCIHNLLTPTKEDITPYINNINKGKKDWKNDILPESIESFKRFMILEDTYVSVLYAKRYDVTIDSDKFLHTFSEVDFPSFVTLDMIPVDKQIVKDKLDSAQVNADKLISEEIDNKRRNGIPAISASYSRQKRKDDIEDYISQIDENDEKGYFVNMMVVVSADTEDALAERVHHIQEAGKKEGVYLSTCDYRQLKSLNTALPIGGRQVDYMRFILSSSLVAFQPYHAQDIIEPGGQMLGVNRTTKRFIIGNRFNLPNAHCIVVGYSGSGKSMYIKLTEFCQTLIMTDDDVYVIDPQNEFEEPIHNFNGSYFDLTPKSGIYLNGFEVTQEVFNADKLTKNKFIAKQTEYAKVLCAATMKNINVTQEHDSIISECCERMFFDVFSQKKLKKQPTLIWLREEIKKKLDSVTNKHDEEIIRVIYNSLAEYCDGSCDMLAHPSNINISSRLVGFGMANVPENNWEAVMVTVLHYLDVRMDYNREYQKATHLIVDETQIVSKKPGSAKLLSDAVLTFRKFGGIITLAMQNITAALSNQNLVEMFSNCAYKCFFDQGGVDAQELAAIQEFSDKEFKALSSSSPGQGVMVWDKKVLMFDARVEKDNPLYKEFSTNFHEKKEEVKTEPKEVIKEEQKTYIYGNKKIYDAINTLSALMEISVDDIVKTTNASEEECQNEIDNFVKDEILVKISSGKYKRKKL